MAIDSASETLWLHGRSENFRIPDGTLGYIMARVKLILLY